LITYIKGGTPAQFVLERGSTMTRATFVIFWPKLSSFIDWCCYYTHVSYTGSSEPLVSLPCSLGSPYLVHTLIIEG
jgi:hypothetical protein